SGEVGLFVIEGDTEVVVRIPVQADAVAFRFLNGVSVSELRGGIAERGIVDFESAVADAEFDGAPISAGEIERAFRTDGAIRGVFAGEHPTGLHRESVGIDRLAISAAARVVRGANVFGEEAERAVIPAEEWIQAFAVAIEKNAVGVAEERAASGSPVTDSLIAVGIVDRHVFVSERGGETDGQSGESVVLFMERFEGDSSAVVEIASGEIRVVRLV